MQKANLDRLILIPRQHVISNLDRIKSYASKFNAGIIHTKGEFNTKGGIEASLNNILRGNTLDRKFLSNLGRRVREIKVICSNSFYEISREKSRLPNYLFDGWTVTKLPSEKISISFNVNPEVKPKDSTEFINLVTEESIYAEFIFDDELSPVQNTPLSRSWAAAGHIEPFFSKSKKLHATPQDTGS